jgi:hypothetical protein
MRARFIGLVSCVLSAAACGSDDPAGPSPMGDDLGIAFIQRLPEIDFVWDSDDPAHEGWPAPGAEVVWRAHIRNGSDARRERVPYRWVLDGAEVGTGVVDIPAAGGATVDLTRPWTFDRQLLVFEIDTDATGGESGSNDRLEVFTDALSVGFYVERSFYDYFARHQAELGIGSTSFEDWAQRQIRAYNEMFEAAVYPETPAGVLDRLRLDRITIVEDRALPLLPIDNQEFAPSQAVPNLNDRTVDIQWGFPASVLPVYQDTRTVAANNQFYYSGFVQHEMGHARYLVDVYGLNVYQGTAGDSISILEGGRAVAGSRFMPGSPTNFNGKPGIQVYETQQGLMHSDWMYLDRHSAGALNRIARQRARRGNFNSPENLGEYLNDLPAENRLTVENAAGQPLPGARVSLYRSEPDAILEALEPTYRKHYDAEPDMELVADNAARVLLGRDPFSGGTGVVIRDEFTNGTVILRVEHEGRVGYGFLDVTWFNQAYWRGETALADHVLRVQLHES